MKRCSKCKESKSVESFNKATASIDGLQWTCKECLKEYRKVNKAKIARMNKEHYLANKETYLKNARRYYLENTDKKRKAMLDNYYKKKNNKDQ